MAHIEYYENIKMINDTLYHSHSQLIENVCNYLNCPERTTEVQKKFLDETIRMKKAKRDPNQPKRAKSAYMIFCDSERGNLDSGTSCIDQAKELGKRWTKLNDTKKQNFKQLAEEDKKRYTLEMDVYKNNLFNNDPVLLHKTQQSDESDSS